MRTTTQLIYFWASTCHKTTMCGETAPGFMQRTNEHWNALVKGTRSTQQPGYATMSPLGPHTFVVLTLMALPLGTTKFERVQKESLIIRNFQCRGNSPYCHRVNQNAEGIYKQSLLLRDLDGKKKVRSKREGTSLDALALELRQQRRITLDDVRHVKLERIKLV